MSDFRVFDQASPYVSPWSVRSRVGVLLWEVCWSVFCGWTPKPFNRWRLMWLRLFGADIRGIAFVHSRASVIRPWNLSMHERACLGDGAVAYCLDKVVLETGATLAQGAYLCSGTHDFDEPNTPLRTAPIRVGAHAFVALRAIVLPGVTIGEGCVVGAGAVVSRDTEAWSIYAGMPARKIGARRRHPATSDASAPTTASASATVAP